MSTISGYIARQQDGAELESRNSIYGPYQEINKGLLDQEQFNMEVIKAERKIRASRQERTLGESEKRLIKRI